MKFLFAKTRWTWLRFALAVLLPLHTGFAQATMVMHASAAPAAIESAQQAGANDLQLMPDGMPCHHAASSSPPPDHPPAHKDGCCDAGSCHCVAACGLCLAIARIAPQPGLIVPPFSTLSVPAAAGPPELRPPIH